MPISYERIVYCVERREPEGWVPDDWKSSRSMRGARVMRAWMTRFYRQEDLRIRAYVPAETAAIAGEEQG